MIKIIVLAVVVLIVVVLIYAATKPNVFRVQRTADIKAPPEKIFALVNSFSNWGAWSPYEKLDPAMKKTFSGATAGKGAIYEWEGNSKAGAGRIEIIEASPPSKIAMNLDMYKPMEGHNLVEFTFHPNGAATRVTWAMQGPSPFISKLLVALSIMDKMVGGQFEEGLAKLKAAAERN